jgi:hypothetical protein
MRAVHAVPFAVDGGVDHPPVVGEVGEPHDGPGGRGMVGGQHDELRFALDQDPQPQPLGDVQRTALDLVHEGDVELPFGDPAQQRVGGDVHLQGGLQARPSEPAQPAGQGAAGRGADPQPAVAAGRRGAGLADQCAHVGQQRPGPAEHRPPERGGAAAGALPGEQGAAQGLFDAGQLGAQRGLRHAQLACRPVQAAGVGDGAQCA